MTNTSSPQLPTPANGRRRKRSLRFAVAGIAVLAATPAAATVLMQNFVRADVNKADACMVKTTGTDSVKFNTPGDLPYVAFSDAASVVANGTNLINETLSITALRGDRLLISDGMRIVNNCDYPISVQLSAEADPAGGLAISGWSQVHMELYLASAPGGTAALPFSGPNSWDMTPIVALAAGTLGNLTTGSTVLQPTEQVQIGALIDTDRAAATGTGTVRFTVTGTAL